MPRSIPDLLRNGDSGMGRSRQDSVDLDNLDFDPIDYSMKGLSKMQLNESRARRTHASSPQQPNRLILLNLISLNMSRSLFGDLQAPIGMMGLFGERPVPRQQSGKDEGHWWGLLQSVTVLFFHLGKKIFGGCFRMWTFTFNTANKCNRDKPPRPFPSSKHSCREVNSCFNLLLSRFEGPPGLGGPPGFSQSPLLGFPDAGNAFARQNSRQPFESEFIPKGLLD